MQPHSTSPGFVEDLGAFVDAFVSAQRKKRYTEERERQILAEMTQCRRKIRALEVEARRRPSVHRQIAQLVHEIRGREIELAFLEGV